MHRETRDWGWNGTGDGGGCSVTRGRTGVRDGGSGSGKGGHEPGGGECGGGEGGGFPVPVQLLALSWSECARRRAGTGSDVGAVEAWWNGRGDVSDDQRWGAGNRDAGEWIRGLGDLGDCGVSKVAGSDETSSDGRREEGRGDLLGSGGVRELSHGARARGTAGAGLVAGGGGAVGGVPGGIGAGAVEGAKRWAGGSE